MYTLEGSWDFSLVNYDKVWFLIIQVAIVLSALLVGNVLRIRIPFLKKGLVPSSLIGGFVLLIALIISRAIFGVEEVDKVMDQSTMQIFTYHSLGIGFAAMSLKMLKKRNKVGYVKFVENGALTGATYMIQAIVGILISVILFLVGNIIFYDAGILLPLGFGQGPGNALTWDINFTNIIQNGEQVFAGNGSFGLSLASIGFIVASVIGVIYINIFRKKGQIIVRQENMNQKDVSHYQDENEIEDTDSIDKFSIQIGFVLLAYLLSFLIMFGLAKLSSFTNSIAWGFNFIWAVISANLIKLVLNVSRKKKLIKKKYINNYQMDRISGFAFDFMIVSGVAAIEINDVAKYILPLVLLCVAGTIVTFIYIRLVTKARFKGYEHEMFVVNFGALTGTASNGMILLKEIDPNYETPASDIYIQCQLSAMIFVAPLLLILNFSTGSLMNTLITLGIFVVLFIAYNLFIFRESIFKKKKK